MREPPQPSGHGPRWPSGERGEDRARRLAGTPSVSRTALPKPAPPVIIIDDYAHHPTEIRATLKTVRELFPHNKIIAVFQPHTYSRTRALLDEFAQSFSDADMVYILETYASARERGDPMMAKKLAVAVAKHHTSVQYSSSIPATVKAIKIFLVSTNHQDGVVRAEGSEKNWRVGGSAERSEAMLFRGAPRRSITPSILITMGAGDVWQISHKFAKLK